MKNVYLLIRVCGDEIVECYSKVFTSLNFAKTLKEQFNDAMQTNGEQGRWTISTFELDEFKTAEDLIEEN